MPCAGRARLVRAGGPSVYLRNSLKRHGCVVGDRDALFDVTVPTPQDSLFSPLKIAHSELPDTQKNYTRTNLRERSRTAVHTWNRICPRGTSRGGYDVTRCFSHWTRAIQT